MKAVRALYTAQAREFLRDRTAVLFILLLPVAFGVFFGLIFSGTGDLTIRLGLVNEDIGPTGAGIVESLAYLEEGGVQLVPGSRADLLAQLDRGDLHIVLVFPQGLSGALAAGEPVEVEAYYDSARTASQGIGLGLVEKVLDDLNLRFSDTPRLLTIKAAPIQAEPPRAVDFYLPGMLGVALLWLGIFGVAQPLVSQREAQVLRRLSLTAITRRTMLAAEVGWRVTVGIVQAGIFVLVGYAAFDVGVQDWAIFSGAVLLGTAVFVALGYALAGLARTTESAMAIAQLVNVPMMMLSGSFFDTEMLPGFFRGVVRLLPLTYLGDLLRVSMTGARPLHEPLLGFVVLGGWFAVLLLLAVGLWKWE